MALKKKVYPARWGYIGVHGIENAPGRPNPPEEQIQEEERILQGLLQEDPRIQNVANHAPDPGLQPVYDFRVAGPQPPQAEGWRMYRAPIPQYGEQEVPADINQVPLNPGPNPLGGRPPQNLRERIIYSDWKNKRFVWTQYLLGQPKPMARDYIDFDLFSRDLYDWKEARALQDLDGPTDGNIVRMKKRGEATPRFSLPYSPEEMKLRLKGTIVTIDDRPCYVVEAGIPTCEGNDRGNGLIVQYANGEVAHLLPGLHEVDFRPFEPGYVQRDRHHAETYVRKPARVFRQGLHNENTALFDAATGGHRSFPREINGIRRFLKSVEDRNDTRVFSDEIVTSLRESFKETEELPSIRLSNRVAVKLKGRTDHRMVVVFKGIDCGSFDGSFRLDDNFCSLPYIRKELTDVGIKS